MNQTDFDVLAGRDDAIYKTLGLLVRQLHVRRIIDAPDLIRELHLLTEQMDCSNPKEAASIQGMNEIATAFEAELPRWTEARAVTDLYLADSHKD